jgi:hypothetical protein
MLLLSLLAQEKLALAIETLPPQPLPLFLTSPLSALLFPQPTNSSHFTCGVAPAFTSTSFFILIYNPPAFSSHSSSSPPNHVYVQQHEWESHPQPLALHLWPL